MKTMLSCAAVALAFLSSPLAMATAQGAAPVQRFASNSSYYIYYGAWDATLLTNTQANGYKVVVCEPRNMTQAQVADLQNGTDNVLGNADDIKVYGYISFGEDNRPSIYEPDPGNPGHNRIKAVAGGQGPKIDPRRSPNNVNPVPPISSIAVIDQTPPAGVNSPGGVGYSSYYLDGHDTNADGLPEFDGKPDTNGEFGGAYVNAGDPAWYTVLKNMVQSVDGNCGLDEILTTTVGKGLGCDGIFTDTIDTCAPDSFAPSVTMFEWTAPGYRHLMKTVKAAYPTKFILQNRGTFFFRTDVEAYNFSTRPFIDGVFFESYFCDSNDFDTKSPYFNDNKWNVGKHINAEADRADGFTVFALNYLEPRATRATITMDGNVGDWPAGSNLQVNGGTPDSGAINGVSAANDATYLYLRVSTDASTNLNSSNFNIYFDTDDVADIDDVSAAGYVPTGAGTRIKSELLYQWGGLYSQDTGNFNLGQVGTASVSPNAGQTEWEIRIPRAIVHPATHARYPNQNVFGADGTHILMLLTYDVAGTTQYYPVAVADGFEKNLGYRFEQATPGSVFDDALTETIQTHGWLSYQTDKFLSQAPNTRAAAYNSTHADTAAPVWSTTANGFVARGATPPNGARTGVQEVVAGSGSATVRWDLADDQTRPVRYKVYYAPASPDPGTNLAVAPWVNTGYVSGTAPSNYKWGTWAPNNTTVFANEYVVTGLTNGVQYKFVVRAADSATTVHEDTNLTALTATPFPTTGSVYANITVDGTFTDWPASSKVWSDPQSDNGTGPTDLKALYLANDTNNIYVRVESWNSHDWPQATPLQRMYFDTDQQVGDTAHNAFSLNQIYSELLMEGGVLYSQKDGSYAQTPSLQSVGISPFAVPSTNWEFSIPRNLHHLDASNVFSSNGFKLLANSGNNTTDEFSGVASYIFAPPPTGSTWATIAVDGSFADWPAGAQIWSDPQGDQGTGASDLKALWLANDATNIYVRVESWNSHDWPQTLQRLYFDTDLQVGDTGHNAFGLGQIYSELLMEGGTLYSEKDGNYSMSPALQGVGISPFAVPATSWEFSIPRNLHHLDATNVFTTTGFKMLANSGNTTADEFAGVVTYTFATGAPTPTPTPSPTPSPTATPTVTPTPMQTTVTFNTVNAEDGDVLESTETSGVGGTVASTNTTLRIGDDASKKQYRTVLSFDTSSLPDAAVIDNAVVTLTRTGVTGNPSGFGTINIDIKAGNLGAASTLATDDFAASVTSAAVGTLTYPATNIAVSSTLNAAGRTAVSKTAKTQFRVAFTTDDDNDAAADNLQFAAGENGTSASRPKLVITYH